MKKTIVTISVLLIVAGGFLALGFTFSKSPRNDSGAKNERNDSGAKIDSFATEPNTPIQYPIKEETDSFESSEIYCLGIIVDTDLPSAKQNLESLKKFVTKKETEEQISFTIKDSKNKNAEIRTFYAINGGTEKEAKNYFMTNGSDSLNLYGGLEFDKNYPESYLIQRLNQLMGEQGNCGKVYIHKLNDLIPLTIIDKFYEK